MTGALIAATLRNIETLRAAPLPPAVPLATCFAGVSGMHEAAPR